MTYSSRSRADSAQDYGTKKIEINKYRTPARGADNLFSVGLLYVTESEANVLCAVANQLQAMRSDPDPPSILSIPMQRKLSFTQVKDERRATSVEWSGEDPRKVTDDPFLSKAPLSYDPSSGEYIAANGDRMRVVRENGEQVMKPVTKPLPVVKAAKPAIDSTAQRFSGIEFEE